MLKESHNNEIVKHVCQDILDKYTLDDTENSIFACIEPKTLALTLYPLPSDETIILKNRKFLSNYLKNWGDQVGIPFVNSITYTSFDVETIKVPFDPETIREGSRKRKKMMDLDDIKEPEQLYAPESELSNPVSTDSVDTNNLIDGNVENQSEILSTQHALKQEKEVPSKNISQKKKKKPKKSQVTLILKQGEKEFQDLISQSPEIDLENLDVQKTKTDNEEDKKTVSWGPETIKRILLLTLHSLKSRLYAQMRKPKKAL